MLERQYFYTPFSAVSVVQGENPSLLLQFIIFELLKSKQSLTETTILDIAPFGWAIKPGSKNKIAEYGLLLPVAFPHLANEAEQFLKCLERSCAELLCHLEPFIFACQENENLLFFLVKHQKSLSIKSILDRICPEGVAKLKTTIAAQYKKRGFHISKWSR